MSLTLDDIIAAPSDPQRLTEHLTNLGLVQPTPQPVPLAPISPAKPEALPNEVGPLPKLTPAVAPTDVKPMMPPNVVRGAGSPDIMASFAAASHPATPFNQPLGKLTPPEIGGAPAGATPEAGLVKPMTPPVMPTGKESRTSGREEYFANRPQVTAKPGSSEFWEQKLAQDEYDKAHPWGSDVSAHPGILGKIGHIAGMIGQTAGAAINPGLVAEIPGTRLNRAMREAGEMQGLTEAQTREGQEAERTQRMKESEQRMTREAAQQSLINDTEGNVTGWKSGDGKIHSIDEEGTPQAIKDVAEATEAKSIKPSIQKMDNGDIVSITPGKNGEPSKSEVVYHGDPKVETDVTQRTVDGQEHHILVNKKTGEDIKDLGAFKTEPKPQTPAQIAAGEKPVLVMDKNGQQHLMSKAEADADPNVDKKKIISVTAKEMDDLKQNGAALNDMGYKLKNLHASSKALDQGAYQRSLITTALKMDDPNSVIAAGAIALMTPQSKEYVQDVFSMREAALALPKQTTGGSRVSEPQAKALWNTIPGAGGDSKYAEKQLRKFDENLARLWNKVPHMEGQDRERTFGEETSAKGAQGGGGVIQPPQGKVSVVDPKGVQHFVNENAVDDFLKDPQYKGWKRGTGR